MNFMQPFNFNEKLTPVSDMTSYTTGISTPAYDKKSPY